MPMDAKVAVPDASPAELARIVQRMVFSGGNEATLLRGGDELFPAMVREIECAQHEIWLATYIYDNTGGVTAVTQALIDAAGRGVQVKMVLDGFGSRINLPGLRELLEQQVERVVARQIKYLFVA